MGNNNNYSDFESASFLQEHCQETLSFYSKNAQDPKGGFFHCLNDEGRAIEPEIKHLVSSCRYVFNYTMSFVNTGNVADKTRAQSAWDFLLNAHNQNDGSYAWELNNGKVSDDSIMAYGHAFVMLASACAVKAGLPKAKTTLDDTWNLMETHFWEQEHGAYCDEFAAGFKTKSNYRGQNANMHMCEACIAAWQATGELRYLERAEQLAKKFAYDLAALNGGLVWEHFNADWTPDYNYNIDKPDDLFKPWGFQPGHQVEWARLLLLLDEIKPNPAHVERAQQLFDNGLKNGRDNEFGGIYYGVALDGSPCSQTKYYWVQSETIATAWRLFQKTGDAAYREEYLSLWRYAWDHFVDHEYGAWYRILTREGAKVDELKSPPGKTDYHTLGVCWDILSTMKNHKA